jgi:hypothetical protein
MSLIFATQLTAIATAVLALFAIVTAYYARKAFLKQSREIRDQAEMLRAQSEQLEEHRKINAEQTRVLELQAAELNESLRERIRDTEERKSAQAARIIASFALSPGRIGARSSTTLPTSPSSMYGPSSTMWPKSGAAETGSRGCSAALWRGSGSCSRKRSVSSRFPRTSRVR